MQKGFRAINVKWAVNCWVLQTGSYVAYHSLIEMSEMA
jgi:hypothetical protein